MRDCDFYLDVFDYGSCTNDILMINEYFWNCCWCIMKNMYFRMMMMLNDDWMYMIDVLMILNLDYVLMLWWWFIDVVELLLMHFDEYALLMMKVAWYWCSCMHSRTSVYFDGTSVRFWWDFGLLLRLLPKRGMILWWGDPDSMVGIWEWWTCSVHKSRYRILLIEHA